MHKFTFQYFSVSVHFNHSQKVNKFFNHPSFLFTIEERKKASDPPYFLWFYTDNSEGNIHHKYFDWRKTGHRQVDEFLQIHHLEDVQFLRLVTVIYIKPYPSIKSKYAFNSKENNHNDNGWITPVISNCHKNESDEIWRRFQFDDIFDIERSYLTVAYILKHSSVLTTIEWSGKQ